MASILKKINRRIIPRWRRFKDTVALGELDTPRVPMPHAEGAGLQEQFFRFEHERSVEAASDLLGAAIVLNAADVAQTTAKFLLQYEGKRVSRVIERVSRSVLEDAHIEPDLRQDDAREVHTLRSRLRRNARDPISWTDLALSYTILGEQRRAERALNIALSFAPNNRFVLRSAVQFFSHIEDFDRAHRVLRQSQSVRHDPWLLAAELAVESARDRRSKLVKSARLMIDDYDLEPWHFSELASALGTMELEHGSDRKAKRLFRKSLIDPTENSIAQAKWASDRMAVSDEIIHAAVGRVDRAFEARAWGAYNSGLWREAFDASLFWLDDQPFAVEAAIFRSFLGTLIEEYEETSETIERGLRANPENITLLNNLAYVNIMQGNIGRAEGILSQVVRKEMDSIERMMVLATSGLLCYRKGDIDEGRRRYQGVIEDARTEQQERYALVALVNYAREELRIGASLASRLLSSAKSAAKRLDDKDMQFMLSRIEGGERLALPPRVT